MTKKKDPKDLKQKGRKSSEKKLKTSATVREHLRRVVVHSFGNL